MRLLLVAFFVEAGLVLLFIPWLHYWEDNYFLRSLPLIEAVATNAFVRGAVSGVGLLNMAAAVAEMHAFVVERRLKDGITSITHAPAAEE